MALLMAWPARGAKLTLEDVLRNTLERSGEIQEVEHDLDIARAQLERARAAAWPQGDFVLIGAPIWEETGDALRSVSNFDKWGPFVQTQGQVIQPLFTFGQISNYKKAARKQIEATTGLVAMKRAEVLLKAKEFFYGYQMAYQLEQLLDDLVGFLEEAVETVTKSKGKGKGKKANIKPHDLYNLKTNLENLRQLRLKAIAGRKTAERAVSWISVTEFETLGKRKLKPVEFEKKELEEYVRMAKAGRPEFDALNAGIAARRALANAKDAQSNPTLFLGAFWQLGWSPVRQFQPSIYANDPFNRLQGGAALGVRINLEFKRHSAEAAEERAQAMKLEAQKKYAGPGVELQVKKAFWELEEATQGLEIAKKRKRLGRKWFVSNGMGWSIGVVEAKDLMEALEGDGKAKQNYIESVYAHNMAVARLSQAVGKELAEDLDYGPAPSKPATATPPAATPSEDNKGDNAMDEAPGETAAEASADSDED